MVSDLVIRAKRERPRRSIRRIIRMLERARVVKPGELSRSSVHRLLCAHGISGRPKRGPSAERRSFLVEHASDLWIGDAMHGPEVIAPGGQLRKSYLLSQIDAATRYLLHSYFALAESAVEHEYGFKQAVLKAGPPRAYYVDLGAAYIARSLRVISAELGIHLVHTAPKDCEAKGAIERFHRTWREEVGDELPDHPLPLAELNAIHWAWIGAEYHARRHDTTTRAPREHWLGEIHHLRSVGHRQDLDEIFLHRADRKVRKDGTVRWAGGLFEVRSELVGGPRLLVLDPLVRPHRRDENHAGDVAELLAFLRELQRTQDLAIAIVHHMRKGGAGHSGQALRGSGDFHAWTDSALYLRLRRDRLVFSAEHRAAPAPKPLELRLCSRPDGSATHLEVVSGQGRQPDTIDPPHSATPLANRVAELLEALALPVTRVELRRRLRVNNQRLGQALADLDSQGVARRSQQGWLFVGRQAHD